MFAWSGNMFFFFLTLILHFKQYYRSPDVYYEPRLLEEELEKNKIELDEFKYKCKELEDEVRVLKKERIIIEKENNRLIKFTKVSIIFNINSDSSFICIL